MHLGIIVYMKKEFANDNNHFGEMPDQIEEIIKVSTLGNLIIKMSS